MADTIPHAAARGASGSSPRYPRDMGEQRGGSPIGEALVWVSRIIALGLTMFLPGVGGGWLDRRLGTSFLGPAGLILGFALGLLWIVQLGSRRGRVRP